MNNTNKEMLLYLLSTSKAHYVLWGRLVKYFTNALLQDFKYGRVTDWTVVIIVLLLLLWTTVVSVVWDATDTTVVSTVRLWTKHNGRVSCFRRYWHDGRVYYPPVDDTRRSCPPGEI